MQRGRQHSTVSQAAAAAAATFSAFGGSANNRALHEQQRQQLHCALHAAAESALARRVSSSVADPLLRQDVGDVEILFVDR
eukprot:6187878-Pleurochrysis_carterae.AAC.1